MASSNIKLFDENKGNMLSDYEFSISNQRVNGLQAGVASSQLQNKAMYQASLIAYAIAQVMMQNGKNANDTDAVSTFVANLSGTMLQKVYDIATTAEAQAGVATGKWMSPALVKAAIDTLAAKAQNILSDETKVLYGLSSDAVPDDVFKSIPNSIEPVGTVKTTLRSDLSNDWLLANGEPYDTTLYSGLKSVIDPNYSVMWGMIKLNLTSSLFPSTYKDIPILSSAPYTPGYVRKLKLYGEYVYFLCYAYYGSNSRVDYKVFHLGRIKKDLSGDIQISKEVAACNYYSGYLYSMEDFAIQESTGKCVVVGNYKYSSSYSRYYLGYAYADSFDGIWNANYVNPTGNSYLEGALYSLVEATTDGFLWIHVGASNKTYNFMYSYGQGPSWTTKTKTLVNGYTGNAVLTVLNDTFYVSYHDRANNTIEHATASSNSYNAKSVTEKFNWSSKKWSNISSKDYSGYGVLNYLGLIPFEGKLIISYEQDSYLYDPSTGNLTDITAYGFKSVLGNGLWHEESSNKYWVPMGDGDRDYSYLAIFETIEGGLTRIDSYHLPTMSSVYDGPTIIDTGYTGILYYAQEDYNKAAQVIRGNYSSYRLPLITLDNAYCYIKGR